MKLKNLLNIRRQLNKPEYVFQPTQLLKRISYSNQGRQSVKIPLGKRQKNFIVNENEVIGRSIMTMGVYDLIVAEAIHRLLSPGDTFVDVGANIGYFTRVALSIGAQVESFEPHPKIFKKLQENLIEFTDQANAYNLALSNSEGIVKLYIPNSFDRNEGIASLEPQSESTEIEVLTKTIDSHFTQSIDLLKIDVEGHELSVLEGASEALANNKIRFIIFEDFNGKQSSVITKLQQYGFYVARLEKTLLGPRLRKLNNMTNIPAWEPPNYIATRERTNLEEIFKPRGWQFLSQNC